MSELTALKCKTCGNMLDLTTATDGVVECPYCYNKWTVAKKESDPAVLQFLRMGEHDLDTAKFDDAFAAYSKAAELDGSEPEAYFGKALAKFKVQYLKDEVNNRMQPICHAVTTDKFSDDPNFMRACLKATSSQRAEYEKRAKDIDYIQSEFAKLEKSGIDYDCFICVKVTGADGGKTDDSKDADYIYRLLQGKGYKPFYSEYEIRNKQGADYEAHILYALKKSECMLIVCRDEESLQTKWVKNEYTRFLKLVNDEEKESDSITFVFYQKAIERLPGRQGKLQGIDFSLRSSDGQILDFVERHTPESRARAEAAKTAKAKEEEEQKAALAEQKRLLEEQQKRINEQLEKLNSASSANMGNISYEELAKNIERERLAREEAERKKAEEERRMAAEEEARKIALKKAEAERLEWIRENEPTVEIYDKSDFEIDGTELKKYLGKKTDVKIPRGITSIGKDAFDDCKSLTSIIMPNSVTSIGEYAFSHCESLTSITIPNGVTSIGEYAFSHCESLTSITIPNGVTSIGGSAFCGCTNLKSIIIANSVTSIGKYVFSDCTSLTSITIPNSVTSIGDYAFWGCTDLTSVTIGNGVTSIGENAFWGCTSLESVTIPDSVTSIGNSAFCGCTNLKSIIIANSVTSIGNYAFRGCTSLTSITIPNSVTSIGDWAFRGCTENFTIYCRAVKRPKGWDKDWDLLKQGNIFTAKRAKVVWGYKG